MERMFILVTILWLAALDVAHAQMNSQVSSQAGTQVNSQASSQTSPQVNPASTTVVPSASATPGATQASPGGTGLTQTLCSTSGTSVIGVAPAQNCATDPLSVPVPM